MHLRSGKIISSGSMPRIPENITFTHSCELSSPEYSTDLHHYTSAETTKVERSRLDCEIIHIISQYIDKFASSNDFKPLIGVFHNCMQSLHHEITATLNAEYMQYTENERAFLGNVRADAVKLAVLLKNRQ